ncbi:MAG: alkaline phosphatase family protein [Limisphaerales bacterium]
MAGNFSTFIRGRIPSAKKSKRTWANFRSSDSGDPQRELKTPQGSADSATRWIAESAKWIENKFSPTLNLIYLPHLDYNLQRHGPKRAFGISSENQINPAIIPDLRAIDAIVGDLIDFFSKRNVRIVLLSEYGITNVNTPIHLNRIFREQNWLTIKMNLDWKF